MGCNCGGGSSPEQQAKEAAEQENFTVTLPDGTTKTVKGEHAAKVAVTVAGGGRYSRG